MSYVSVLFHYLFIYLLTTPRQKHYAPVTYS